jgi:mono/diheme cytochrome c family protein
MTMRCTIVLIITFLLAGCSTAPASPARTVSGAATFATHCAACHGPQGEGNGPVAATLRVPVPNLRTLRQRNGQFPTEWVASKIDGRDLPPAHGDRAMPVWGGVFDKTGQLIVDAGNAEQRIEAVIDYLQELQIPAN